MVDKEKALVVEDVAVVVVVQLHWGATVVADVLDGLGVGDCVGALLEHVGDVIGVQLRVDFWIETVHQLDTVGSAYTVCTCAYEPRRRLLANFISDNNNAVFAYSPPS